MNDNENRGRISEIQKNTYTISFQGKEVPAKLKGVLGRPRPVSSLLWVTM